MCCPELTLRKCSELVKIIDEEFDHRVLGAPEGPSGGGDLGGGRGGYMTRGDGRGYRTYRQPGTEVGEIRDFGSGR